MDAQGLSAIFATHVLERAEKKGWSINRLADFAGVSRGFLSDVLRQKKVPTLKTIASIAGALEVEPWKLLKPL